MKRTVERACSRNRGTCAAPGIPAPGRSPAKRRSAAATGGRAADREFRPSSGRIPATGERSPRKRVTPWRGPPGCGGANRPWLRLALPPIPHCARESLTEACALRFRERKFHAENAPPTRRRNARTAYESGAKRSDFGRRRGDARPRWRPAATPRRRNARRNGARSAAAAERTHRRRRKSRLGRRHASPIRSDGLADARSPARRKFVRKVPTRLAVSCSGRPRTTPFSLEIAPLRRTDPQRTAPKRPKAPTTATAAAAARGLRIKTNPAIAARARAR